MKLTIQSILRAVFAPILFMLLAVSVSENVAAQVTVQLCDGSITGNGIDDDPHSATGGLSSLRNSCRETGDFSGNAYIATDPSSQVCGACIETTHMAGGELSIGDCNVDASWVKYQIPSTNKFYCGPISQCVAAGGTRGNANDNAPTCANECATAGERLFNNNTPEILGDDFCAASATCQDTHILDETNSCIPRVAANCPDNEEFQEAGTGGGTCVQCEGHEFSTGGAECTECDVDTFRGTGASCVACPIANEGRASEETACSCPDTHYDHPTEERCDPIPVCTDAHHRPVDNVCEECDMDQHLVNGECVACDANEVRAQGDAACTCPHYDNTDAGTCDLIPDCTDAHHRLVDNVCEECDMDQHLVNGVCEACPDNGTRSLGDAECTSAAASCDPPNVEVGGDCQPPADCMEPLTANDQNVCHCPPDTHFGDAASCVPHARCETNYDRNTDDNTCACNPPNVEVGNECQTPISCAGLLTPNAQNVCACQSPNVEISGVCEAERMDDECTAPETINTETNRCACQDPNVLVGEVCHTPADCMAPLTANAQNVCHCPPDTHFGDAASCVLHAQCETNYDRNADDNTCACNSPNIEVGNECRAVPECTAPLTPNDENVCACQSPNVMIGEVCEASLDGTCTDPRIYISETNSCDCPSGQRENADTGMCEAIPASGGGGSSSGGGAAAAIIAVPVILIGGYYLLGGFGYVDPYADFSYSGENENFHYAGNAGFNLRHGGLHSYASAVQSTDGIAYHSGISYERDYLALNYGGVESDGEYAYDLAASAKAEFGLWTIAPTAAAEFQYQTEEEIWKSDVSAGLETAWTAQKWTMRARSNFAGDGGHALDLELKF